LTKKKPKPFPDPPDAVEIESLAPKGQGLARVDGRSAFLHGALPGERVRFRYTRIRKDRAEGAVVEVL